MKALGWPIAVAGVLLATGLILRAPRTAPAERASVPLRKPAPSPPRQQLPETASSEAMMEVLIDRLKSGSADPASAWSGMLRMSSIADVLRHLSRCGPLEQGFAALRGLVAERDDLRDSLLHALAATDLDEESRLLALRLLPPFTRMTGDLERSALLRLLDRPPEGELGRQFVRYVATPPRDPATVPWLSRLLERGEDPSVKTEALRALARCPDPMAESILKRCFDDPNVPAARRAAILSALAPQDAARYPWLDEALENCIRLRPGDSFDPAQQELALHAVTILARNGAGERLAPLMESETCISDPRGRSLVAFALRWLPREEAAARLASMASNPAESPKVRLIALESLRGRTSPAVARRLQLIDLEPDVSPDLKAALDSVLRD